jgi:hypothetical protein
MLARSIMLRCTKALDNYAAAHYIALRKSAAVAETRIFRDYNKGDYYAKPVR